MTASAQYWVEQLELMPHPEGGYFRETYRAEELIPKVGLPERFDGERSCSTGIYFLLESDQFSALHRIKSDEMWHFYAGGGLRVYGIAPTGSLVEIRLGCQPEQGETFQAIVPAGYWFGATVTIPNSYALVGCTVAPGFDFQDFELGERSHLIQTYPQHEALIRQLTHG